MSKIRMMFVVVLVTLLAGGLVFYGGFTGCSDESRPEEIVTPEPPPIPLPEPSPTPESDTVSPTISLKSPAPDATGIPTNTVITVTFSEAMNEDTVKAVNESGMPVNFILTGPGNTPVTGSVACNTYCTMSSCSSVATFSPAAPGLVAGTQYAATVKIGVTDKAGNALAAEVTWNFTTAADASSTSGVVLTIDGRDEPASDPKVAVDVAGNAVAVWVQNNRIFANRHMAGSDAWGRASPISKETDIASEPQVAASSIGSVIAVWKQKVGDIDRIRGVYWSTAYPRGIPLHISDDATSENSSSPQVAISSIIGHDIIVVWVQAGKIMYRKIRYNAEERRVNVGDVGMAASVGLVTHKEPHVAMDTNGNAVIVYTGDVVGTRNSIIYANYCVSDSVICSRELKWISALRFLPRSSPKVAIDSHGNAIALWQENDNIMFNVYNATAATPGWGRPTPITSLSAPNSAISPLVAVNTDGNITATWMQLSGGASGGPAALYAIYCPIGTDGRYNCPPDMITQIDNTSGLHAEDERIGAAGNCNPIVAFKQGDNIWYNRYNKATPGWEGAMLLTEVLPEGATAGHPDIAMSANNCSATAVWVQGGDIVGRVLQ